MVPLSMTMPLLVLTAVPFGVMGAIFGHFILNWEVSMFSFLGVIACAGVVVNDNLVLLDCVNQNRQRGMTLFEAVVDAGATRFRPIMLTSLTTFAGMAPMIIDNSVEARFLVPMAVSLAFGVMFATLVSLILVPSLMLLAADAREQGKLFLAMLAQRWSTRHEPRPHRNDSPATAYRLGCWARRHRPEMVNPYVQPEQWAAWEAGKADQEPPAPIDSMPA